MDRTIVKSFVMPFGFLFAWAISAETQGPQTFTREPYVARYNAKVALQFPMVTNAVAKFNPRPFWSLGKGTHRLALRGREWGSRLDSLFIGKEGELPGKSGGLTLGVEKARVTAPMRVEEGAVKTLVGGSNDGEALFEFLLAEGGDFRFSGKACGPNEQANSFFVSVDGGAPFAWSLPIDRDNKTKWVEIEDRGLDPFLPTSFWLTWGATSPLSEHRENGALRAVALKLTGFLFDQIEKKGREKAVPSLWFIRELETAYMWQQDPRIDGATTSGFLRQIKPYLVSCHNRATNGDGWGDNTPNILLQQAAILRLASVMWKTEDKAASDTWAAVSKSRMDRALALRQPGGTFGYSYGSGVDANYFNYDGNYLSRYAMFAPGPEVSAALKDMAVAAQSSTWFGQPVSIGAPWWKHTFAAYNGGGAIPEAILAASRDPAFAHLVTQARQRLFRVENLKSNVDLYDKEIGVYYNMLQGPVTVTPVPFAQVAYFSQVENGPVFRKEGLMVAMPWRSWCESTCGATLSTPDAVESQLCSVLLTAKGATGSARNAKTHFPDAYSIVEDRNPLPLARGLVLGPDFTASATTFLPALGAAGQPDTANRENKSPWRRTDIYFADVFGFAGALTLEALEPNTCSQVALWVHGSDDLKIDGAALAFKPGYVVALEEKYAGKVKNLGKTWGFSAGYYPLDLYEAVVKDSGGAGFQKGETFRAVVSFQNKTRGGLRAQRRETSGPLEVVEIFLGDKPRALLVFNPTSLPCPWAAETRYQAAYLSGPKGDSAAANPAVAADIPPGAMKVFVMARGMER